MGWFASIGVAVLAGGVALLLAGLIANACANWYRVSGFEGKAGYFVVVVALLGGLAGFVLGLVLARFVAGGPDPGFPKALGLSVGVVAALAGVTALVCRALADVPPTLDGQELMLEVELRLPEGETPPAAGDGRRSTIRLGSVVDARRRSSWEGTLEVARAQRVDGRWVLPGSVYVYTRRGLRMLETELAGTSRDAFMVPLPAHATHEHEAWSGWLPRHGSDGGPWPATKISYRFRVRRIEPEPPAPDPEVEEAGRFAALAADAPLAEWLEFFAVDAPEERAAAIRTLAQERPAELAALIGGGDDALRERALEVVAGLETIDPAVTAVVQAEGQAIADGIARFNTMAADDPRFHDVQLELNGRFTPWKHAWWNVHRRLGLDGRPPLQRIYELAQVRGLDTNMGDIVVNARVILEALEPASPELS